jgi:hypothetical protein
VLYSHEVYFINSYCKVWDGNWCGSQKLFQLVMEFLCKLFMLFLTKFGDVCSNELFDFCGTQQFGALRQVQRG